MFAPSASTDTCPRSRGCQVLPHNEHSVDARYGGFRTGVRTADAAAATAAAAEAAAVLQRQRAVKLA